MIHDLPQVLAEVQACNDAYDLLEYILAHPEAVSYPQGLELARALDYIFKNNI